MASLSSAPDAGAANAAGTETSLGNEIGLGNLTAVQHATVSQSEAALHGSPPAIAAVATSLLSYHQANLAAVVRSGQVLANGVFEMRHAWAGASAASLKGTCEAMVAFASVKCVKDLVDVQSRLVRSTMEKAFAHGVHVAGSSMRLTHQALEPISSRMSASTRVFVPAG